MKKTELPRQNPEYVEALNSDVYHRNTDKLVLTCCQAVLKLDKLPEV